MKTKLFFVSSLLFSLSLHLLPTYAVTYADSPRVKPSQAPWVVSLWLADKYSDRATDGFFCTGSLINSTTVVTAAHCFFDDSGFRGLADPIIVVRGQIERTSRGEVLFPRDVQIHPDYDPNTMLNDVAIIDLVYPTTTTSFLKLATAPVTSTAIKTNLRLYGWGLNENQIAPQYLQSSAQKNATKIAAQYFSDYFDGSTQIGAYRKISSSQYSEACSGDSGGPLTTVVNKKTYLVGIVSYGAVGTCQSNVPAVYTRVAAFRVWLVDQVNAFKQFRVEEQFDVSNVSFFGTTLKPLETALVRNPDDSTSTLTKLVFGSQYISDERSDLVGADVLKYSRELNGYDVEVRLLTKTPFADGCDWSENPNNAVLMNIRSGDNWDTSLQVFLSTAGACLTSTPIVTQVASATSEPIPSGCSTGAIQNSSGGLSILLTRECFEDPKSAFIRFEYGFNGIVDLEPGWDLWAGPVDLSN